jgi:Spy/CpxP family protein refolding chaperone
MAKQRSYPVFVRPCLSILALSCAVLGATAATQAQTYPLPTAPPAAGAAQGAGPGAAQRRPGRLRMVLGQLGLTPNQRLQIRSMVQSFRAARGSATPITRRQLLTQIEGVLTQAQRAQFEAGIHPQRRVPPAAAQSS